MPRFKPSALLVRAPIRKTIIAAALLTFTATMFAFVTPGQAAREVQWCAKIGGRGTHCSYHTEEQCRASLSGRSGTCFRRRS
ncbi:DUF3551 domain-containing protein [Bradyrhizobium sp. LB11.1]|uniref:DUF3551 domain-containing protein n=1 Tax=Bradyrhizobium sp. LB11.1 TaxID=3156326 RepID=UPI0033936F40